MDISQLKFGGNINKNTLHCPNCSPGALNFNGEEYNCYLCSWRGSAYFCHPKNSDAAPAEAARLEDAVCAHHPGKKAVAICAGSGDYICSLCKVELNGNVYSVQYLDRGGKEVASKAFANKMLRPDRKMSYAFLLSWFMPIVFPIIAIYNIVQFRQVLRQRREDPIYREVSGLFGPIMFLVLPILIVLVFALVFAGNFVAASR